MLKETVIRAFQSKFGSNVKITPSSKQFAVFDAKHPEVGCVVIEEDGTELLVTVGNITHSHFGSYDDDLSDREHEAVITDNLIAFLEGLFTDKYLLFKARWGGGWVPVENVSERKLRSPRRQWFKWSGPVDFRNNPN